MGSMTSVSGNTDRFYGELASFHGFAAFVEFDAHEPLPDD
jgi:hypothetical protein